MFEIILQLQVINNCADKNTYIYAYRNIGIIEQKVFCNTLCN